MKDGKRGVFVRDNEQRTENGERQIFQFAKYKKLQLLRINFY